MATWAEIRAAARDTVHSTFAASATYFAPGADVDEGVPVTVRHHTAMWTGGDLDREGYAQQVEDINRLILDTEQVTPAYKGKVVLSNGDELFLEVAERQDAGRYQAWSVLRQR